jgi:Helix-turn-helix domain
VTLTVTETGGILGVCRNTAYTAVKTGEIPSINLGGRIAVPVAALRRKLGEIA